MRYDTPEDALRGSVEALGGLKKVGVMLWPQLEEQPDKAGRKLADRLNDERDEKLAPAQMVFIFRKAQQAGFHEGMYAWNRLCGYSPSKPLHDAEELQELHRKALAAAEAFRIANEELTAKASAMGLEAA